MGLHIYVEGLTSTLWFKGATILIVTLFVIIVTATDDYVMSLRFRKFNNFSNNRKALVTRNGGKVILVPDQEILVGDIIHLKQGDYVPADCLLIEGEEIESDESLITGKVDPIKKVLVPDETTNVPNPFLLANTLIVNG
jgi:Ca2+-transporting ATPase